MNVTRREALKILGGVVLLQSGCASSTPSSGIDGQCVVQILPGPVPNPEEKDHLEKPTPLAGAGVRVLEGSGEQIIKGITADARGRFRLILPPGQYRLMASLPPLFPEKNRKPEPPGIEEVTVKPHGFTTVQLTFVDARE